MTMKPAERASLGLRVPMLGWPLSSIFALSLARLSRSP
jgi:hypothetical protein